MTEVVRVISNESASTVLKFGVPKDQSSAPKSRTERPRKTKIGTEVAHVTCDPDTTFKVNGELAGAEAYCGGQPHSLLVK